MSYDFSNYDTNDTIRAELNNNLTLVDALITAKHLKCKPAFYILGGAALVFYDLNYKSTLDIDSANRIEAELKEAVSLFIDDAASEVCTIACNYMSRAKRYREDLSAIEVYLLSKEDLLITKLGAGRRKDIASIQQCGILKDIDYGLFIKILNTELTSEERARVSNAARMIPGLLK